MGCSEQDIATSTALVEWRSSPIPASQIDRLRSAEEKFTVHIRTPYGVIA